ncbi:MAG: hypothetical protein ABH852_01695 [Methanobacteriota archaeon]
MTKTITVSDEVYKKLLEKSADHQRGANHKISMSEVIAKLLKVAK